MAGLELNCPYCRVRLRIKDRAHIGPKFSCPECAEMITAVADRESGWKLSTAVEASDGSRQGQEVAAKKSSPNSTSISDLRRANALLPGSSAWSQRAEQQSNKARRMATRLEVFKDPLVMVWTAAIAFATVMLFLLEPWADNTARPRADNDGMLTVANDSLDSAPSDNAPESPNRVAETIREPVVALQPAIKPTAAERIESIDRLPIEVARPDLPAADEPTVPAVPPRIDVEAALNQPIVRFELATAAPLRDLLLELEELAAVPIHYDPEKVAGLDERLRKPVSIKVENTTVGEILRSLLRQAELEIDIEHDGIHLRSTAASPDEESNRVEQVREPS